MPGVNESDGEKVRTLVILASQFFHLLGTVLLFVGHERRNGMLFT